MDAINSGVGGGLKIILDPLKKVTKPYLEKGVIFSDILIIDCSKY